VRRAGATALRFIGGTAVVAVLIGVGLAGRIYQVGRTDSHNPVDVIVVLGAAQYDGTPSAVFQARLDHAAALYRAGVAAHVVTIGGRLAGDRTTEAEAGRQALIDAGLPASAVVAVPEGNDTLVSLRAGAEVLRDRGWQSVLLVTDPWHAFRSRLMARDLGLAAEVSPVTEGPSTRGAVVLPYVLRETAGTLYYLLAGGPSGAGSPVL
jgi:uncharacterized SAM-binding protein YcdF (DUF218 family)